MGGFVAAQWAALHPGEVESLWLLGPAGTRAAFEHSEMMRLRAAGENPLLSRTPDDFARTLEFVMHDPPLFPPSLLRVLGEKVAADHALNERIFAQLHGPDSPTIEPLIEGLATPALVVWGRRDRVLGYQGAKSYARLMPNAQVILLDEIGHLPMLEAPGRAAADYLAFRAALVSGPLGPAGAK